MAFNLPDDSHVSATISFMDDAGNAIPAPPGAAAAWSSSDPTVITVVADPSDATGMTGLITAVGKQAVATVQLQVTVPGDPKSPYTGVDGDVAVGAGALNTVNITFGSVTHN
jgi:hypothetical protein